MNERGGATVNERVTSPQGQGCDIKGAEAEASRRKRKES